MAISPLDEYLATIPNDENRARMVDVLVWVGLTYPELELRIAWNQPMFTHHGTYIIGFSAASTHMAMAPERATTIRFESIMRERGTGFGTILARQPWDKPFDYELLDSFIQHQLEEKQGITSFWRPQSRPFQHEPARKTLTTCTISTCQQLRFLIFARTRLSTSPPPKSSPSSFARAARRLAQSWSLPLSTKRQSLPSKHGGKPASARNTRRGSVRMLYPPSNTTLSTRKLRTLSMS